MDERTDGRTDVRTDGHFPPLILLGRLLEVDLKTSHAPTRWRKESDDMCIRFDRIPQCDRRADGQICGQQRLRHNAVCLYAWYLEQSNWNTVNISEDAEVWYMRWYENAKSNADKWNFSSCRATLCVSAVFAVARCPSVCPSRWCTVLYPDGWRYRQTFFLIRYHRHSSFLTSCADTQFHGNPFSGPAKYTGVRKFAIFDWNSRLSRKQYEIGPWLLWNVNRKL